LGDTPFDSVIRSLNAARSRRDTLTLLLGGLPGLFLVGEPDVASAKRKKGRHKRHRRKDRRPNNDGPCGNGDQEGKDCRCKNVGDACADDASCCPRTKGLSCQAGTCQPCDVCLSGCDFDSVQAAIDAVAPGETIRICAGVFAERLVITKEVTLIGVGDGANGTTLDGRGGGSTVTVSDATATLQRLRITGGGGVAAGGGAIVQRTGTLLLSDCAVTGNSADADGGGIATKGVLRLENCTVADNKAGVRGGGIVHNDAATTLENSVVSGNQAGERGGGIFFIKGAMTLFDSRVENNTAEIEGGGIFRGDGAISLFDSTVTGNSPDNCAGSSPIGGCVNV
jgi:hypothetical protein